MFTPGLASLMTAFPTSAPLASFSITVTGFSAAERATAPKIPAIAIVTICFFMFSPSELMVARNAAPECQFEIVQDSLITKKGGYTLARREPRPDSDPGDRGGSSAVARGSLINWWRLCHVFGGSSYSESRPD